MNVTVTTSLTGDSNFAILNPQSFAQYRIAEDKERFSIAYESIIDSTPAITTIDFRKSSPKDSGLARSWFFPI